LSEKVHFYLTTYTKFILKSGTPPDDTEVEDEVDVNVESVQVYRVLTYKLDLVIITNK
jgi:hypothetical protein